MTATRPFDLLGATLVVAGGALGESIVVLGAGTEELELDAAIVLFGLLALALSAALWWVYFSDENAVEEAFHDAASERRPQLALVAFGYWPASARRSGGPAARARAAAVVLSAATLPIGITIGGAARSRRSR